MADLLVLGSGIAGLSAAIHAARRGLSVVVLTKGELALSATRYAQGGVAAALEEPDSAELHLSDTLAAGAGLCDPDAVRVLVTEGPGRVRDLMALGAVFDRTGDGATAALALAREGGHSVSRVVHAGGDATGAEIERALVAAVHALDLVEVRERCFAVDLIVEAAAASACARWTPAGAPRRSGRAHTIVATGGAGQLFAVTTNPVVSTGDGIALALRAGAAVADVEFMQFHPTALHHPSMPRPLLSEALRGEGAVLRDEHGVAFMADEHPLADLAPRDVVARAIARRLVDRGPRPPLARRHDDRRLPGPLPDDLAVGRRAWASTRAATGSRSRRPRTTSAAASRPISTARRRCPGSGSCGEAACSGVHGANRLASNSLLDGLVFAPRVVDAIVDGQGRVRARPGCLRVRRDRERAAGRRGRDGRAGAIDARRAAAGDDGGRRRAARPRRACERCSTSSRRRPRRAAPATRPATSCATCSPSVGRWPPPRSPARSRAGTHTRLDFPERSNAFLGRFFQAGDGARRFHPLPADVRAAERMIRDLDPPHAPSCARSSPARWPRTSACSATSRRSR